MNDLALHIALVGERDDSVPAHRGIPLSLRAAASALGVPVTFDWLPTDRIQSPAALAGFDGIWCVPATPYRHMDGALLAIRHARENRVPFLGTCGGFQHALVEYARDVLGWADADHAESAPDAQRAVISPLACSLIEATEAVHILLGSRLAEIYDTPEIEAGYLCRYGLNPAFSQELLSGALRSAAVDATGEVRAVELSQRDHPFFLATLFQPERAALKGAGAVSPLVTAFVAACREASAGRIDGTAETTAVAPSRAGTLTCP